MSLSVNFAYDVGLSEICFSGNVFKMKQDNYVANRRPYIHGMALLLAKLTSERLTHD